MNPEFLRILAAMGMQQQGPVGSTLASQAGAPQQQGGLRGFLGNRGAGTALQQLGFGMMAQSDTPGSSLMGNIGRAAPGAMQAYQQAQQKQALSAALQNAPGGMQRLIQNAPQLAMQLQAQRAEANQPTQVSSGAVLLDAQGNMMFDNRVIPKDEYDDFGNDREAWTHALFPGMRYGDLDGPQAQAVQDAITKAEGDIAERGTPQQRDNTVFNLAANRADTRLGELATQLQGAGETLGQLQQYRGLLEELGAEPYTGKFANAQQFVGKVRNALAGDENDDPRSIATEALNRLLTSGSLNILGRFPGQLSEKELAVAMFLAGEITFEEANINNLLDGIETAYGALERQYGAAQAAFNTAQSASDFNTVFTPLNKASLREEYERRGGQSAAARELARIRGAS